MSAWYLFSSIGFYPVFTASGQYIISSPIFDKVTINLENGKAFTVEAQNNSKENIYVQEIYLNGTKHSEPFITHNDIMNGGTLQLIMGNKPNYSFGTNSTVLME